MSDPRPQLAFVHKLAATSDPEQRAVLFAKADTLEGLADPGRVRAPEWRPPPFDEDPAAAEAWERYQAELAKTNGHAEAEPAWVPAELRGKPVRPADMTDADWERTERIYAEGRYAPDDDEAGPTSWAPVDLSGALKGDDIEPPRYLERSDGLCLLYAGRVHAMQGESESLKSWCAQLGARQAIEKGGNVLYIDFEDDARGVVGRLRALGLHPEEILEHFVYVRPDEPLRTRHEEPTAGADDLRRVLAERSFDLVVIDGVTEAMTIEGLDLMSNADVAVWMRRLPRYLARTGAAVVVIDHLPKDRANQGRYSLGAQHKLSGLDGAAYKFQLIHYFSRALGTDPVDGRAVISVEKDRPGYVRGRCIEDKVGELHLTSYPDGGVTGSIDAPTDSGQPDVKLLERVLGYLAVYDGSSKNAIELGVEGRGTAIRDALAWVVSSSLVTVELKGRSHLHWLTEDGRTWLRTNGGRDE